MHTENGCRGDTVLGLANYKEVQQDLTELNGDGNRERGHYGEDQSPPKRKEPDDAIGWGNGEVETIVPFLEDDGQPSTYEEYQDVFGGDDWDHGQHD